MLGVAADASDQEVKRAYRALAKELHPDVAGDDPERLARFKEVTAAYETLSDPERRRAYDRMKARRGASRGWSGGFDRSRPPPPSGGRRGRSPANDLDLEDLFTDFNAADFGFGGRRDERAKPPAPGRDVPLQATIHAAIARDGGTVGLTFHRLRRADGQLTLVRVEELYDLRVPPGTRTGDTLRVEKMGDAGEGGGPYGDLVVDVRVVGTVEDAPGSRPPPRGPSAHAGGSRAGENGAGRAAGDLLVDISIAEAVLGGRVPVQAPGGTVRIAIPAGTNSGTRFRLRGMGPPGPGGAATDAVAEVRIVVPRDLDEESRRLITAFAERNPRVDEA